MSIVSKPSSGRGLRVEAFQRQHRTGLVTLVFTDLVDSVALRRQLGDQAGTSLVQAHRQLVRQTLERFADAEEIETAGDSFLLSFARPRHSREIQSATGVAHSEVQAKLPDFGIEQVVSERGQSIVSITRPAPILTRAQFKKCRLKH